MYIWWYSTESVIVFNGHRVGGQILGWWERFDFAMTAHYNISCHATGHREHVSREEHKDDGTH
jgi:hypothetical protein